MTPYSSSLEFTRVLRTLEIILYISKAENWLESYNDIYFVCLSVCFNTCGSIK